MKVRPPIYAAVHAVMFSKEEAALCTRKDYITNEGRHHLLLLLKSKHVTKEAFALHVY